MRSWVWLVASSLLGYLVFKDSSVMRKISSAIILVLFLITFLIEKSIGNGFVSSNLSGAIVGVNAGILVFLICLAFSSDAFARKVSRIILGIIAVVAVIAGFIGFRYIQNYNVPEARLLQISASDATAQTRFWVWNEAWKGFLERPLLGWGPENFTPVFDKFFNPQFYVPGQNSETWFDRAHSVFFDYLVETGILGLLSYLAIFFTFYWEFIKKTYKNVLNNEHAGQHRTLIALRDGLIFVMPIAYLVQGVAIFDVLPMYLCLFLFLAFATYRFSAHKKS